MRAALYFVVIWMAACNSPGDHGNGVDPPGDGHDLVTELDGMQSQGTFLLGQRLDTVGHEAGYHTNFVTRATTADGQPVAVSFDGSAALRSGDHRGADRFFDGMLLFGSEGSQLRIVSSRGGYDVALYKVEIKLSGEWQSICDAEGDEAIPLAGKWQHSGYHEAAAGRFSFACTGAVAFKCSLWGYLAGGDSSSMAWRAHQACTRMARGDYCASGHPHTREGTQIMIYDLVGVASPPPRHFDGVKNWPPNVDRRFFEAAWGDGAHPASCLSRLRWQSLPTGPVCEHDELRDPRLDTGVRFCEDIDWQPGSDPTGAILFNESRYTDLSLHVWSRGPDQVSTVQGFYEMPDVIQPFPAIGPYDHVRTDGIVLRWLRPDLDPADFETLRRYGRAGDLVVAGMSQPPPGFDDLGFEGYARKQRIGDGIALNLYRNASTGDYLSTTGTPAADYELQWTIGYVLPPETSD